MKERNDYHNEKRGLWKKEKIKMIIKYQERKEWEIKHSRKKNEICLERKTEKKKGRKKENMKKDREEK